MSAFDAYSRYYDLLYRDKDYAGEADYVHNLIQRFRPGAHSLLDLGCGTGRHAALLAAKGYAIEGVDASDTMLAEARKNHPQISFHCADIRGVRIDCRADAVVALFHVLSYQTSNEDLQRVLETARVHLNTDGILIFDCWYGPTVLTEKPEVRVKDLEDDFVRVSRVAEPVLRPNDNIVEVNYRVLVTDKKTGITAEIREKHVMRYLFVPEIDAHLACHGFKRLIAEEWMTGQKPGLNTWGVCFVAQ